MWGILISLILICVLFGGIAYAQDDDAGDNGVDGADTGGEEGGVTVDKAYKCLENRVSETSKLGLQEAIFSMLALGVNDKIINAIEVTE